MWIARDRNGELYLYKDKPKRGGGAFNSQYAYYQIHDFLFPELKWENEPIEVEIKEAK